MQMPKVNINLAGLFGGGNKECSCKEEHNIFDLTRDVVCYNQGKIAEYYFLHDKYQKELIAIMNRIYTSKDFSLIDELKNTYDKYNAIVSSELNQIVQNNLEFSDKYFLNRRNTQARSCIKILDKDLNVIDPFRENDKKYKYNKNTGFQRLIDYNKSKNHYLCNNIPEAVANNNYKNTRIKPECMKKYYKSLKPKNKIFTKLKKAIYDENQKRIEAEWIECWKGYGKNPPNHDDCYKSTLIIPMTFKNNSLSPEFISEIKMYQNSKDINTLGFLCFDHIEVDYFNSDKDINFCYKIADLVSLFLLKDFISKSNKEYQFIEFLIESINKGKTPQELIENLEKTKKLK